MQIDEPLFRERIYNLINGNWDVASYPVAECEFVKNEFAEGSDCHRSYEQMLEAYTRLCKRLQVENWNDRDVDEIIDLLLQIGKHQAMKMFAYGVFFARRAAVIQK